MAYYTLLIRDDKTSPWRPEFGDYSKAVVQDELDDNRQSGEKLINMKIIKTEANQRAVNEAVAKLNRKEPE